MKIGIRDIEQKYEILSKLGEGGMGAIYRARHKLLDEDRVIKIIRPQLQEDEDLQQRFLREAQVAAKMRHPHIATLHDFAFTDDDTAYIVMEFIEGRNMRDYQRKGGRLTVHQVVEIGRQGLEALGYLHDRNFVHRDISTDNMMLSWNDQQPRVTLIDLGLAKNLEGSQWRTKTGMVVGKVRYISPEQLNSGVAGVEVDARSDLYSFGVVLYELLTGEFPITGGDDMSLIAGHLYREPRPFEETDPRAQIPAPLRHVVMRALQKKPEYRFPTAQEFSQALQAALTHGVADSLIGPNEDEMPTARISGAQITAAVDPYSPTATVGMPVHGQATQPAIAPGEAPFTRANVPQPSPGHTQEAQPQHSQINQTQQAYSQPAAAPGTASQGTASPGTASPGTAASPTTAGYTSIANVDQDARTAPITMPVTGVVGSRTAGGSSGTTSTPPAAATRSLLWPSVGVIGVIAALVVAIFVWRGGQTDREAPAVATVDGGRGAVASSLGKFYAVVIGNSDYAQLPSLDMATFDAEAVARVLESRYGFEVELIRDASRQDIISTIYQVGDRLTPRDSLLVYYAGHGALANMTQYWQGVDAEPGKTNLWISTRAEIAALFDRMSMRHVLVVSDSCFAGATANTAFTSDLESAGGDLVGGDGAGGDAPSLDTLATRPSRMVLASGGLSPVLDAGSTSRHSVFAEAFLDALESNTKVMAASELYSRIAPEIATAARRLDFVQEPILAPMYSSVDKGGEFFFVPAG